MSNTDRPAADHVSTASTLAPSTTPPAPTPAREIPKQSASYILRSGLAGGIAACAAKTVVAPLDRVKILFQASNPQFQKYTGSWSGAATAIRDIHRSAGIPGLFRGHSATLLRIFPYGGIKFLAYEQVRNVVIRGPEEETVARRFVSGALSGCVSVFATYPLEVIRVRLAWETKDAKRGSVREICRTIYYEHPPQAPTSTTIQSTSSSAASPPPSGACSPTPGRHSSCTTPWAT